MTPAPFAAANATTAAVHAATIGAAFAARLLQCFGKTARQKDTSSQAVPLGARAIDIKNLRIERGGRTVLDDLSLTIGSGEITAVVGPSGAGKSTFLAALTGLVSPRRGRILVGEQDLADPTALQTHRLGTATIFQEHALIDRLSALDNVLLGLADSRHPLSPLPWPQSQESQAAQALADVGLLHLAHRRTGDLSGGERQRVGIARALVRKPAILLGDEPFSAIDPALSSHLGSELRSLVKASGITVVLVLHQIDIARSLADRIVGLADGRIAFDGPAASFDLAAHDRLFSRSLLRPSLLTPSPQSQE
ncbi:MAG TPA: ATP-binding cassette domain-containing protein [Rhodocyclaceae bacterium]|jgi:phosphonate transport system ATP-binding protein|nr:ATP-binding cassette domain-containing protein [Rhodocyclaceae bacterium]